ncbi:alpha/beta-Hydrolase [Pochonia chlamydosporia 170]|uniref:Alpha/beta-Hydrolase n=1 Tax=Pochonia chlamydosporia 170 TaxID=1380566 RepID=A0A179FZQ8_METCM|nr:alpha/beta-Hydrolase [Pochonia chlamydosporia 170]OAQ71082.1 alpha/beta-Hydrolase [Pochonia chlamydosporia 170]
MSSKPTFVLVPGAWHAASTWDKVKAVLSTKGYKSVAVTLPSTNGDPSVSFADDIKATRDAITLETTAGLDVVVVVHSYGGFVGLSAIKGLSKKTAPSTATGHVIGVVLIATGFNTAGMSFLDCVGGTPPPTWKADTETGFAVITADIKDMFYHDLPDEEAEMWASRILPQSLKVLKEGGEDSYEGWRDVPCWQLQTTEDRGLPIAMQKMVVQMAKDRGVELEAREIQSSHSPMLSRPEETVAFLEDAAKAFGK